VSGPRTPDPDRRWPRQVYAVGTEPDPRFTFANERTFLAWIRTALGFLAAGVAIVAVTRLAGPLGLETRIASIALIVCGLVCGVAAFRRWMVNEQAMRLGHPLPSTPMLLILTGIVGGVALVALVVVLVT
jgi:putative membrane protein